MCVVMYACVKRSPAQLFSTLSASPCSLLRGIPSLLHPRTLSNANLYSPRSVGFGLPQSRHGPSTAKRCCKQLSLSMQLGGTRAAKVCGGMLWQQMRLVLFIDLGVSLWLVINASGRSLGQ